MSWTKPGSVSSSDRMPPPTVSFLSNTQTERPARANSIPAARPLGPDPMTVASYSEDGTAIESAISLVSATDVVHSRQKQLGLSEREFPRWNCRWNASAVATAANGQPLTPRPFGTEAAPSTEEFPRTNHEIAQLCKSGL